MKFNKCELLKTLKWPRNRGSAYRVSYKKVEILCIVSVICWLYLMFAATFTERLSNISWNSIILSNHKTYFFFFFSNLTELVTLIVSEIGIEVYMQTAFITNLINIDNCVIMEIIWKRCESLNSFEHILKINICSAF